MRGNRVLIVFGGTGKLSHVLYFLLICHSELQSSPPETMARFPKCYVAPLFVSPLLRW